VTATVHSRPPALNGPPACELPAELPRYARWVQDEMTGRPATADPAQRRKLAATADRRWLAMAEGWPVASRLVTPDHFGTVAAERAWPQLPAAVREETAWALTVLTTAGASIPRCRLSAAVAVVAWASEQYGLRSLVELTPVQWGQAIVDRRTHKSWTVPSRRTTGSTEIAALNETVLFLARVSRMLWLHYATEHWWQAEIWTSTPTRVSHAASTNRTPRSEYAADRPEVAARGHPAVVRRRDDPRPARPGSTARYAPRRLLHPSPQHSVTPA
jgi:hypothetical protein